MARNDAPNRAIFAAVDAASASSLANAAAPSANALCFSAASEGSSGGGAPTA